MRTISTWAIIGTVGALAVGGPFANSAAGIQANPDTGSVDAILAALYDVISGPARQTRDWDRFRSLFAPKAMLRATGPTASGDFVIRDMTPEQYIECNREFLEGRGFFETEISRTGERFGNVVHAFSTYESRRTPDAEPFSRGINSIQLVHDGERWWIVSVLWTSEREGLPIPERYGGGVGR